MEKFEHLTDVEVLIYACHALADRMVYALPVHYDKYERQFNELMARIRELQGDFA